MDAIQKTLIKAGRRDLAKKYYRKVKGALTGIEFINYAWADSGQGFLMIKQKLDEKYGTPVSDIVKAGKKITALLEKTATRIHNDLNKPAAPDYPLTIHKIGKPYVVKNSIRVTVDLVASPNGNKTVKDYLKKNYISIKSKID